MKVKTELLTEKCLSFGIELNWDKRVLRRNEILCMGIAFLCFTVIISVRK